MTQPNPPKFEAAVDLLREDFSDPAELGCYLASVALLKYLEELKEPDSDIVAIPNGTTEPLLLRMPPAQDFFGQHERIPHHDIDQLLNYSLRALQEVNESEMDGMFTGVDFCTPRLGLPDHRQQKLRILVDLIGCINFSSIISFAQQNWTINDLLLKPKGTRSASRFMLEYVTPADVATLMSRIVVPRAGESIYDPACGSGRLLLACINEASSNGQMGIRTEGDEKHYSTWALAKLNYIFNGRASGGIKLRDSARRLDQEQTSSFEAGYDIVLSNPPKGLRDWERSGLRSQIFDRLGFGIPPKTSGDFAFLLHMVDSMKPNSGRSATLVPDGVLFRLGVEGSIRERLVAHGLVSAVISLPARLLYNTSAPTSLLIMRRAELPEEVLFIDARNSGVASGARNALDNEAIARITSVFWSRQESSGFSASASFEEIEANHFSLLPSQYVNSIETSSTYDFSAVLDERKRLQDELLAVENELDRLYWELAEGSR
ncbi:MAG: N-6 DNA methylase [Massilia sp.]